MADIEGIKRLIDETGTVGLPFEDIVDLLAEIDRLRDVLSTMTGVLDALNERTTPRPSMSLRRSLVEQARRALTPTSH